MPIYDYRCSDCGKTFELLLRGTTTPACPACSGTNLEKQVSAPAQTGKTAATLKAARAQASREGHFSNYAPSERPRAR